MKEFQYECTDLSRKAATKQLESASGSEGFEQSLTKLPQFYNQPNRGANYAYIYNRYKKKLGRKAWYATLASERPAGQAMKDRIIRGCCQCEAHSMPEFFTQDVKDSGFPDNKHQWVQLAISAIKDTELTVAFELQHGLYYGAFDTAVVDATNLNAGKGDILMHSPYRTWYTPGALRKRGPGYSIEIEGRWDEKTWYGTEVTDKGGVPVVSTENNRASWLTLLNKKSMVALLPMNLPMQFKRRSGVAPSTDYGVDYDNVFENDIIIDRPWTFDKINGIPNSDPCFTISIDNAKQSPWYPICNFDTGAENRETNPTYFGVGRHIRQQRAKAVEEQLAALAGTEDAVEVVWDDARGTTYPYSVSETYSLMNPAPTWWEMSDKSVRPDSEQYYYQMDDIRTSDVGPTLEAAGGDGSTTGSVRQTGDWARPSIWNQWDESTKVGYSSLYKLSENNPFLSSGAIDGGNGGANMFIAMPWLPYFSNCDHYDSHISISRLVETHPDCILTRFDKTNAVSPYIGEQGLKDTSALQSDKCYDVGNPTLDDKDFYNGDSVLSSTNGIRMMCVYEEDLTIPAGGCAGTSWSRTSCFSRWPKRACFYHRVRNELE